MRKTAKILRKIFVGIVGFPLLAFGIVLIPLPGPGVLVSLIACFVLSLEFDWAEKGLREATETIKKIYQAAKNQAAKIDPDLK